MWLKIIFDIIFKDYFCPMSESAALVYTIPDRCRVCYSCVRECPVKAIRIENGQAEVMEERCIACGNCIKVCSQHAKAYRTDTDAVTQILGMEGNTSALLAPSFPAEFNEIDDYRDLIGMIRALGFDYVNEVAFGADLIAKSYSEIISKDSGPKTISSDCPGIVEFVERYHPDLVDNLVPLDSPMEAIAKVVRRKYGNDLKTIFIGPCIGKKAPTSGIDIAITFTELRQLFEKENIKPGVNPPSDFDPPFASRGRIFPVKRGLLQTLNISENLFEGNIMVAEGRNNFPEAISEFKDGSIADQHLQLLCCDGCIMGPGMSASDHSFARRARVGKCVRSLMKESDHEQWLEEMRIYGDTDLSKSFKGKDARLPSPNEKLVEEALINMGKHDKADHLNCGACGYDSCQSHAIAIAQGLAEPDMCLPYSLEKLHASVEELNVNNKKLIGMKQALAQSEKLAHMGQLSAGIAHELNNPLGVVIMYANILLDDCSDKQMKEDLELITNQADRCKKIVGNLLNFARTNHLRLASTNMGKLIGESINSLIIPPQVNINLDLPEEELHTVLDADQITQVLTNLYKNSIDAMPEGGEVNVKLSQKNTDFQIEVADTGSGIKPEDMDKLFTPFFTTKPIGMGTGLGLATIYGIIKMHKGKVDVKSNIDTDIGPTGTSFILTIPLRK